MQLIELSETNKQEYNRFVAAHTSGSFLQSWEWGNWQAGLGRAVHRFEIVDDNENKVGVVQFIQMSLVGDKYYLYAPYGPVVDGNFQFPISNFQTITNEIKSKFPDAVFIRIEPKESILSATTSYPLLTKSINIQPGKTLVVDLEKSEGQLLSEMHSKTRYNIKVAQKHGVEIKDEFDITVGHGLFFDEALNLMVQTSKRQKFVTFPVGYYKKMADFFTLHNRSDVHLHIYKAIFQNRLLAAAVMIDFGGTRTFLFGGSSEFHKNVMAPYLLHWQAMLDAKKEGLSVYDFWGIETSAGKEPGFVRFKLGFASQESSGSASGVQEYSGAWDVPLQKYWYKIYTGARRLRKILR